MPNDSSHISSHSSISHFGTLIICVSGWDSMCELIDQWINWSRQEPFWYNRKEPQERISPCECLSVHAVQDQSINVCINIPIILLCCKELIQFSWLKHFSLTIFENTNNIYCQIFFLILTCYWRNMASHFYKLVVDLYLKLTVVTTYSLEL